MRPFAHAQLLGANLSFAEHFRFFFLCRQFSKIQSTEKLGGSGTGTEREIKAAPVANDYPQIGSALLSKAADQVEAFDVAQYFPFERPEHVNDGRNRVNRQSKAPEL